MTTIKPEVRKIFFKNIPLPEQKLINSRHIPYPFNELRIGGDAMVVSHVTYGAVVLATRKYMANNNNTAFYLAKTDEGTVVWRVKVGTPCSLSVKPSRHVAKIVPPQEVIVTQIEAVVPVQEVLVQVPPKTKKQKKHGQVAVVVDEVYADKKSASVIDPALLKIIQLYDLRCEAILRDFETKNDWAIVGQHFGLKWNSVQVMCARAKKMRVTSNDALKTMDLVQAYELIAHRLGHANQYSFPSIFGNQ